MTTARLLAALLLAHGLVTAAPLRADDPRPPVDWIATGAFGDVAARAGWRPVTDWVFEAGSDEPRAVPGAGVLLDHEGEARDLYTIASHRDLQLDGEFLLAPGSSATLRFHGCYDLRFGTPRSAADPASREPVIGDPGTILGARAGEGIAPRVSIGCAPRRWHRFSATLRAPRFDARGVRVEPARFVRVVLDGIVLQVGERVEGPSADAPDHERAEGPFALRSGGGPVAYRRLVARELDLTAIDAPPAAPDRARLSRVVVFTRTAGYRHDSIAAGTEAIRGLGKRHGFAVGATDDPAELLRWLDGASAVVFLNTTGDILDAATERAFEAYVRAGGGFVGVHAAADAEEQWPWYGELVGARFAGHPPVQGARVLVVDRAHPATAMLPEVWPRTDEWFDFRGRPREGVRILATLDPSSYDKSAMGEGHPICWCAELGRGRSFYTGGGHTEESYAEPLFLDHLLGALRWAAGDDRLTVPPPDTAAPPVPGSGSGSGSGSGTAGPPRDDRSPR